MTTESWRLCSVIATGVGLSTSSSGPLTAAAPLVLLHPLGSTGAESWASLAESLRGAGHRVAAPDLPGHGLSRDTPFTWESARAMVRAAAERFAPEKPVLIGHSLGAATAIYAAQREPTSFAALLVSGAGACWNDRYVRYGLTAAAAVGALTAAVGRRELLAHAAGVRGRQIVGRVLESARRQALGDRDAEGPRCQRHQHGRRDDPPRRRDHQQCDSLQQVASSLCPRTQDQRQPFFGSIVKRTATTQGSSAAVTGWPGPRPPRRSPVLRFDR